MIYSLVSEKIVQVQMTLHDKLTCGGQSVYIELFQQKNGKNTKLCETPDYGKFSHYQILNWGSGPSSGVNQDGCHDGVSALELT